MTTGEQSTTRRMRRSRLDCCLIKFVDPVFVLFIDKARYKGNTYIYGCQCNERLKAKTEGSTRLTYTGWMGWGNVLREYMVLHTIYPLHLTIVRAYIH
jgi:hypothetical protein